MPLNAKVQIIRSVLFITLTTICRGPALAQQESPIKITPSKMMKLGTVDPRFVSYNVEMVEVTGGLFWKPYKSSTERSETLKPAVAADANQPIGGMSSLYQFRPPINLTNPRLRKLAEALSPAYVRVSGTWANSTYFQNDDNPPLNEPPHGFKSVLTRAEWNSVIEFMHSLDNKLVTSFAISQGTRGADGYWTSDQAEGFVGCLLYTSPSPRD